jgi:hypothetical protein
MSLGDDSLPPRILLTCMKHFGRLQPTVLFWPIMSESKFKEFGHFTKSRRVAFSQAGAVSRIYEYAIPLIYDFEGKREAH